MYTTKLRLAAAAALAVVVFGAGGLWAYRGLTAEAADPPVAPAAAAAPDLSELAKARAEAAGKACDAVAQAYVQGKGDEEDVYRWSLRCLEADRKRADGKAARVAAAEAHLERMKDLEKAASFRIINKANDREDLRPFLPVNAGPAVARYFRAEAEVWVAEAKAE
jgi:hypothetical protein